MKTTVLIRTRFTRAVVSRLDALAGRVGSATKRKVPRAALVRALVIRGLDAPVPDLRPWPTVTVEAIAASRWRRCQPMVALGRSMLRSSRW